MRKKWFKLIIPMLIITITLSVFTSQASSKVLQNGMRDSEVITLKKDLAKAGFPVPGNGTTLFGSDTEKQVKAFQSYYGLTADGIAGRATFNELSKVVNSPLQNGKRHQDTIQLKKDLGKIGYPVPGKGTNLYGKDTETVVKKFQKEQKLRVNGIADKVTLSKINAMVKAQSKPQVDPNNLKNGDRHSKVKQLKKDLAKAGFPVPGNGTTLFGSDTEKQVKAFQSYYGLTADGIAGRATFNELSKVVNSPLQNGKRHQDTIQLKKDLGKIGYPVPGKGTNLYGKDTETVVKKFQKEQKLRVNGIADKVTLSKINAMVKAQSKPQVDPNNLKNGDRHSKVKQLKKDLAKAGFPVPGNGTTLFGSDTEKQVKAFQSYYGLTADGIAGRATFNELSKVVNSPLQNGKRHQDTIQLKKDLGKIGYPVPGKGTNLYGKDTETVVKKFQKEQKLRVNGIADKVTLQRIARLLGQSGNNEAGKGEKTEYTNYNITLSRALDIQMARDNIQTDKYRGQPAYVSSRYIDITGGATTKTGTINANVNVRADRNTSSHIYGRLNKGAKVTILETNKNWHEINYGPWRNPTRSDVQQFLDPSKNDKMQHLRLDSSVGVSAAQLNKALSGKGILAGKGQAFINGTKKFGVNEAYLIAHAQLETGNGKSALATGVKYNGKTVYNMYGIGAVDNNAINGGAKTAYDNEWFTPEAAIEGGAKWIAEQYIQNTHKQNTLYKMRWNPNMVNGFAWKQYASDIGWAVKQISNIKAIYNQLDNPTHHYDIARYN